VPLHSYLDATKQRDDLLSEWKTFFLKIGIQETISWSKRSFSRAELSRTYPLYFSLLPSGQPNDLYGFKNDFYSYELHLWTFIEYAHEYDFAIVFWSQVFCNGLSLKSKDYDRGICYYPTAIDSFNEWYVLNMPIFPTTLKKCFLAKEVFINDKEITEIAGKYLPVFDNDEPLPDEFRRRLPFRERLDLGDYLSILESISKEPNENVSLKKIDQKRIGLIYDNLAVLVPNLTTKRKQEISDWARSNKLLSINGVFLNGSDLFWLTERTDYYPDGLELIFVPDLSRKNGNIEELLALFGVNIISEFKLQTGKSTNSTSLQIELLSKSPYLSAVIEKKSTEDFETIFHNLQSSIKTLKTLSTDKIELAYSFKGQERVISRPSSFFDTPKNVLYFTGDWKSPTTMYSLIGHLAKPLSLGIYQEELRLFLQLEEEEVGEWLQTKFEIKREEIDNFQSVMLLRSQLVPATEEEIRPSEAGVLTDNSSLKTRISINEEAQEIVFSTLEQKGFKIQSRSKITFTILEGIKNPDGKPIKVVVKSAKQGRIYFTPLEWLALAEPDAQLFVLTAGNKVANIRLEDLQQINDEFHMRFNTEHFVLSNLKVLANFFKELPYTHFIFIAPESTADYFQPFGLGERNSSSRDLSPDDKKLMH